jgi:hypothetical protein
MTLLYETGNPRPRRDALPERVRLYVEKLVRELRSLRFHNERVTDRLRRASWALAWLESLHLVELQFDMLSRWTDSKSLQRSMLKSNVSNVRDS